MTKRKASMPAEPEQPVEELIEEPKAIEPEVIAPPEPPVPAEPEQQLIYKMRCINCNQNSQPIRALAPAEEGEPQGYHCPACGHEWTTEDEQAPFRRVQRGERIE